MKKIFYEKVGGRYKPVSEYDDQLSSALTKGSHLIVCYPGGQTTRFNIEPNHAALIAASVIAEDKICSAIIKASELRPQQIPITDEQRDLWHKLSASFSKNECVLIRPSVAEAVRAGTKVMIEEANKLMEHEAVRNAHEQFLTVAKLCSKSQSQ
jgi:hypothetical protein